MNPKLIVVGAAGRMGQRVLSLAIDAGSFEIIAAIDKKDVGKDVGLMAGGDATGVAISEDFVGGADCVIDFSLPEAFDGVLEYCVKNKAALVAGTTGLSDEQLGKIKDAAKSIAVIGATNMSVGMNVLFALVSKAAEMLGEDYDVEIVEQHHRFKKDSPSGSALTLAENVADIKGLKFPDCLVHGRSGGDTLREKDTIGMHAVRAGDIVGIHSVSYSALGETVELKHNAHSRDNFARGAIRAAGWLVGKDAGRYSMADVLGI